MKPIGSNLDGYYRLSCKPRGYRISDQPIRDRIRQGINIDPFATGLNEHVSQCGL